MGTVILKTRDGRLDGGDEAKFGALRQRLEQSDAPLLIHLHGGLVNADAGTAAAVRLGGNTPNSYKAPENWEQVYIVWRTGLLETLSINWRDLHKNDRLYRALIEKLIGFVGGKIRSAVGGRSVAGEAGLSPAEIRRRLDSEGDAPFADLDAAADVAVGGRSGTVDELSDFELEMELAAIFQLDMDFTRAAEDIAASIAVPEGRTAEHGDADNGVAMLRRLDDEVEAELRARAATESAGDGRGVASLAVLKALVKHAVAIGKRVIHRIRSGRGHGVHATIVEEVLRELYGDLIGSAIWGMMKTDASDHFAAGRAGERLLEAIEAGPPRRIMLVGHSAGAIWLSQMLKRAAARGWQRKVDLILLAPAVRCTLFAEALAAAEPLIDRFRMFALGEKSEREDALLGPRLGFLYPSSLLYIVSGLFEEDDGRASVDAPLLGMERFRRWQGGSLGEAEDRCAEEIRRFLATKPQSEVYSRVTGVPGLSCDATSHGGMDDDPETLASVGTFFR